MKIFFKNKGKSRVRVVSPSFERELEPGKTHEATEEEWITHLKPTDEFEIADKPKIKESAAITAANQ